MSGIEIGKAAASAGTWAWKLLENPFIDFLKRHLGRVGQIRQRKSAILANPLERIRLGQRRDFIEVKYP